MIFVFAVFSFLSFFSFVNHFVFDAKLTEIVELDLTQWSPSNTSLNATQQPSASHSLVGASTNSVASAGSGIGSIHLTNVQLEYAPTASPELSLTNTGSTVSNNQSILGMGTTTKREPYLRNWFMSQSSASSHSANAISNIPSHANTGNSVSANASPAASSLNAISTESSESNYQKMKQFSLQQLHTADSNQLPIENSSSTSSVLSSQHHSSITTNTSKKLTTNGEHNGHNSNQMNNSHSHSADVSVRDEPQKQSTSQPKQKSSRRTTSLLNLFMSNSQGNNN